MSKSTSARWPGKQMHTFLIFTFRALARPQVVGRRNEDQSDERQQKVVERSAMFVVLKLHSRHGGNRSAYIKACNFLQRRRLAIQAVRNMLFSLYPENKQPTYTMIDSLCKNSDSSFPPIIIWVSNICLFHRWWPWWPGSVWLCRELMAIRSVI